MLVFLAVVTIKMSYFGILISNEDKFSGVGKLIQWTAKPYLINGNCPILMLT